MGTCTDPGLMMPHWRSAPSRDIMQLSHSTICSCFQDVATLVPRSAARLALQHLRWHVIDVYRELLSLFGRGLRLVCPVCGEGRLFYPLRFKMYERCPVCGFVYEREEGYFTGAMAVNLVIAELLMTIVVIPL